MTQICVILRTDMKKKDLERELKKLGFNLIPAGGKHDKWSNDRDSIAVPRHREINEYTAKGIIKQAKDSNDKKSKGV